MTSAPTVRHRFPPSQQDRFVHEVWPTIAPLHEVEKLTCSAIARVLTERETPLPRNGRWTNTRVRSVVMRAYALGMTPEPARIYPEPKPAPDPSASVAETPHTVGTDDDDPDPADAVCNQLHAPLPPPRPNPECKKLHVTIPDAVQSTAPFPPPADAAPDSDPECNQLHAQYSFGSFPPEPSGVGHPAA